MSKFNYKSGDTTLGIEDRHANKTWLSTKPFGTSSVLTYKNLSSYNFKGFSGNDDSFAISSSNNSWGGAATVPGYKYQGTSLALITKESLPYVAKLVRDTGMSSSFSWASTQNNLKLSTVSAGTLYTKSNVGVSHTILLLQAGGGNGGTGENATNRTDGDGISNGGGGGSGAFLMLGLNLNSVNFKYSLSPSSQSTSGSGAGQTITLYLYTTSNTSSPACTFTIGGGGGGGAGTDGAAGYRNGGAGGSGGTISQSGTLPTGATIIGKANGAAGGAGGGGLGNGGEGQDGSQPSWSTSPVYHPGGSAPSGTNAYSIPAAGAGQGGSQGGGGGGASICGRGGAGSPGGTNQDYSNSAYRYYLYCGTFGSGGGGASGSKVQYTTWYNRMGYGGKPLVACFSYSPALGSVSIGSGYNSNAQSTPYSSGGGGGGLGGCILPNSQVVVDKDLNTIPAEILNRGEKILTYNTETDAFEEDIVYEKYYRDGYTHMYKVTFEDGTSVDVTENHPLYCGHEQYLSCEPQGWRGEALAVGDKVLTLQGYKTVTDIAKYQLEEPLTVYNFLPENGWTFVVDGVVVAAESSITGYAIIDPGFSKDLM